MSIAAEILSLRRDQSSSVATLMALLDWQHSTQDKFFAEARRYAVIQAADIVLLNVAVHALEAQDAPQISGTRRAKRSSRRKRRPSDSAQLSQRLRRLVRA
jgi:hypothetical protein